MTERSIMLILSIGAAAGTIAYWSYGHLERKLQQTLEHLLGGIEATCQKMFMPVQRRRVVLWFAASASIGMALGAALSFGMGLLSIFISIFMGTVALFVPTIIVSLRWQARIRKFDLQLVDALNLLANSLKSGLNLPQALQVLVQEMPDPIAQEFGLVLSQQNIGLTLDEALEKLVQRVPSTDLSVAIHAVLILRETGGDLSETFDVIASTIRERRKVDGKIKSMTQQGKTQGLVLLALPVALGAAIYWINPGYLEPLFTTRLGWIMLASMVILQAVGGLWMKKIVNVDV